MKQIIAIVKPFLVEKILDALRRAPLEAVSVAEVKGMGKQKSYLDRYADTEYALTFLPKVEITVWVDDLRAEDVARKIVEVARTGRMGDGKIFILPAQPYEAVMDLAIVHASSRSAYTFAARSSLRSCLARSRNARTAARAQPTDVTRCVRPVFARLTSRHLVLYTDCAERARRSTSCRRFSTRPFRNGPSILESITAKTANWQAARF